MNTESERMARRSIEWQAQERALERLRQGATSAAGRVDAYDVLFQAIAAAPRSEPPDDFARIALRAVREAEVDEYIERWLMRLAGLVALVGVAVFAGPLLWSSLGSGLADSLASTSGLLSSPMLWASAAAGVTAAACDGWYRRRHPDNALTLA